ncbi:MAG TPA: rhomboid family intramembrane serine protease [Thermohalobaculum sp.]|nr:rhomboid family intramembrane serine protease [Thermohalobaculum sp.]
MHPVLWIVLAVTCAFEGLQQLAAAGAVPAAWVDWLGLLAFYDALFEHALAGGGGVGRVAVSTVTYAFLHAGWLHLGLNMAAFLGLGHAITQGIGPLRLVLTFALCSAAGAVTFGLIADVGGALVGASGAVFGFLGMVTAWQERALARRGLSRSPIWYRIAGLVAINAVLDFGLGGLLAWEAHLGGFVAGWLLALAWPPRRIRLPF